MRADMPIRLPLNDTQDGWELFWLKHTGKENSLAFKIFQNFKTILTLKQIYISVPRADFHPYQLEVYPQGSNYRKTSIKDSKLFSVSLYSSIQIVSQLLVCK